MPVRFERPRRPIGLREQEPLAEIADPRLPLHLGRGAGLDRRQRLLERRLGLRAGPGEPLDLAQLPVIESIPCTRTPLADADLNRLFHSDRSQRAGFYAMPQPKTFTLTESGEWQEWIELATRIRAENGNGHAPDTVTIGGELFATPLTRGAILVQRVHRFADYEDTAAAIKARGKELASSPGR